jgi:outer membrane protein assembly factor BamB
MHSHARRGVVGVLVVALALLLAACGPSGTTSSGAHTATPAPTIASGELGVFLSTELFSPATRGQTIIAPTGATLAALRASDGARVWRKALNQAYSGPSVADGTLYGTLTPLGPTGGQPQTTLTAQRARDGTQVWQTTAPSGPALTLLAANGAVYAAVFKVAGAPQSQLIALRASDGGQLWASNLDGLIGGMENGQTILAANGMLYLTVTEPPQVQGGQAPQYTVVALRASDGKQQWSVSLSSAINGGVSALTLGGDAVYVAGQFLPPTSSNIPAVPTVVALGASDGSTRWARQFTTPLPSGQLNLVAGASDLYAAVMLQPQDGAQLPGGELVGLNPQTGAQVWSDTLPAPALSLVAGTGAVYAATGLPGAPGPGGAPVPSAIAAYSQSDGKPLWSQPVQSGLLPTLIAAANGSVFASVLAPSAQGLAGPGATMVEALGAGDGSLQWKVEAEGLTRATVAPF